MTMSIATLLTRSGTTRLFFAAIAAGVFATASARDIFVKYRVDPVDVENGHFKHVELKPSSLVQEIYYDAANKYLLVDLKGTFYHYCGIPPAVVSAWVQAPSLGGFYNSNVKGQFDCRVNPVPRYR